MSVLEGVEPVAFWRRFEELTRIPRPSRHEEPVIDWVKDWAAERGFALTQDAGRNLVIRVPATAGPRGRTDADAPGASRHGLRTQTRTARTTRPRGGSCSSVTAMGSPQTARHSVRTTGLRSRR